MIIFLNGSLIIIISLFCFYLIRHFLFTLNRAFSSQEALFIGIESADLPTVTILVPAHNEEAVIAGALEALLKQDYPPHLYKIIPVNDRSTDQTRAIIDRFVMQYPGRIIPFHRETGKPGKSAALKDVCQNLSSDILIVFDADYLPAPKLLKNLISPFIDPEVGAVMGRVVPINTRKNFLTRILDMERSAGYQVDQQARMNMNLLPQYGGTVGGLRVCALEAIGGWDDSILAEDTDVTYRLFLNGWSTVYQNSCECYEEVPENWDVRIKQIKRWSRGHNQVLFKQFGNVLKLPGLSKIEKMDALLLLSVFMMAPITMVAWAIAQGIYYFDNSVMSMLAASMAAFIAYSALGNFALFFEIGTAAYLDGYRKRIRLLPLGVFFFLVSLITVSKAFFDQVIEEFILKRELVWDKTTRYRQEDDGHKDTFHGRGNHRGGTGGKRK